VKQVFRDNDLKIEVTVNGSNLAKTEWIFNPNLVKKISPPFEEKYNLNHKESKETLSSLNDDAFITREFNLTIMKNPHLNLNEGKSYSCLINIFCFNRNMK